MCVAGTGSRNVVVSHVNSRLHIFVSSSFSTMKILTCEEMKRGAGREGAVAVAARVAGQMSYPNGGNMCSTCATTLAMAFAAGLVPDPGTCSRVGLESMLSLIMMHSSRIQGQWLAGDNLLPNCPRTQAQEGRQAQERRQERRQVHEVVQLVKMNDTNGMWRTGDLIECFGPVFHEEGSMEEMRDMMDSSKVVVCSGGSGQTAEESSGERAEERAGGMGEEEESPKEEAKRRSEQTFLRDAEDALVKGADAVLQQHMKEGCSLALTFSGHSVCVYRSSKDVWYIFDPLHGELVRIHGDSTKVHGILFAAAAAHHHHHNSLNSSFTGLEEGYVYCGVMAKPGEGGGSVV